jgi:hypothetical protein
MAKEPAAEKAPAKEAPAKKAEPTHGDRLDALEKQHAALLEVARANGWSLPE